MRIADYQFKFKARVLTSDDSLIPEISRLRNRIPDFNLLRSYRGNWGQPTDNLDRGIFYIYDLCTQKNYLCCGFLIDIEMQEVFVEHQNIVIPPSLSHIQSGLVNYFYAAISPSISPSPLVSMYGNAIRYRSESDLSVLMYSQELSFR